MCCTVLVNVSYPKIDGLWCLMPLSTIFQLYIENRKFLLNKKIQWSYSPLYDPVVNVRNFVTVTFCG